MDDFYIVVLVLADLDLEEDVKQAWLDAGASWPISLDATGPALGQGYMRDDIPLFPSLSSLRDLDETDLKFIFTIVREKDTIQKIIAVTEKVIGELNSTRNGVIFAAPLTTVAGLGKITL